MRILILLAIFLPWPKAVFTQAHWVQKVDRALLSEAEDVASVDFLVLLREQADVSSAWDLPDKAAKGWFVFRQLQLTAGKTQPALLALLDGAGVEHRSFYLVNAIQVSGGDRLLIEQLARRADVLEIQPDPWVKFDEPAMEDQELRLRSDVTWGLDKINAPAVWNLGYKGQGVVIGGQDTGYEWDHPAIKETYRGWENDRADHNYNWHDAIHTLHPLNNDTDQDPDNNPCGLDSRVPCDDHNHGTHTIGTMTGNNESGVQIGVAPSARWIGCRNMERGWGRPSSYLECFEWFLAPTNLENNEPDPRLAPHVVNNSWGCPEVEGCNPGNWALMEQAIEHLRAAGIVVVVSAGNSGSRGCGSVSDAPAIFDGSFTVGSTRSNDAISGFSSRGPVTADDSRRLKPNVVAPGSGVRSAVRNGNYATWSGTSMAGPHVAGAVAIIISANPQLAGRVRLIEAILEQSAVPLSSNAECEDYSSQKSPNPVYGHGRIDLLAAVEMAKSFYVAPGFNFRHAGLHVFPNPALAETIFQLEHWPGNLQLRLTDTMGREVLRRRWTESEGLQKEVDLTLLPRGVYFYQLTNENQHWAGTLVKN